MLTFFVRFGTKAGYRWRPVFVAVPPRKQWDENTGLRTDAVRSQVIDVLELDKCKLKARVNDVETAIFNRQQAIAGSGDHQAEKQAIEDALTLLRDFKHKVLGFPEW